MSMLVSVVNQKMYASSSMEDIVAGSQQFVKFRFILSEEWNGLTTFAQFMQNGVAYNRYLDYENAVYLPAEIKAGVCTLMLYGSREPVIGTTNYLTLKINKNLLVEDASSTDISVPLYNQLVGKVDTAIAQVGALESQIAAFTNNMTKKTSGKLVTARDAADLPFVNMVLFGNGENLGYNEFEGSTRTVVLGENLCTEHRFSWNDPCATFPTPTLSTITLAVKPASGTAQINYKLDYVDGDTLQNAIINYNEANNVWFFKTVKPSKPVASVTFYNVVEGSYSNRTADKIFVGAGDYTERSIVTSVSDKLRGIPVTDAGIANYVDAGGQMWCCDTVDYAKGKYVRRIGYISYYTDEEVKGAYLSSKGGLSSGARVYYVLDNPIETSLSSEDIARFRSFHITSPTATIFDTSNAFVEVEYYVPTYSIVYDAVINELKNRPPVDTGATTKVATITLAANAWVGGASPYEQVVSISGVTEYSKVDINPSVQQLAVFHEKDITFVTENDDGVVTIYCIGQKPTNDYTMQVTITEVITNG